MLPEYDDIRFKSACILIEKQKRVQKILRNEGYQWIESFLSYMDGLKAYHLYNTHVVRGIPLST